MRQRCMEAFDMKMRPAAVGRMWGMKPATVQRYFADWKKHGNLDDRHRHMKKVLKDPEISPKIIGMLAKHLGVPEQEVIRRLEKPYALKSLVKGEWPNYRLEEAYSEQEERLSSALFLLRLLEASGLTAEQVMAAIEEARQKVRRRRENPA